MRLKDRGKLVESPAVSCWGLYINNVIALGEVASFEASFRHLETAPFMTDVNDKILPLTAMQLSRSVHLERQTSHLQWL